jgi:hypothetical protein
MQQNGLFEKMVLLSSHTFPGKKAPHRTAVMVAARIKRRGLQAKQCYR